MNKITIYGDIIGSSGYNCHTRQLINALMDVGFDIKLHSNLPHNWSMYVTDRELLAITKEDDVKNSICLFIGLPTHWPLLLNKGYKKFIGFFVWEGDCVPKHFIDIFSNEKVDMIFVPSWHVQKAIIQTQLNDIKDNLGTKYQEDILSKVHV